MRKIILGFVLLLLTACVPPAQTELDSRGVTVGVVQKEIKIGMSGADVLAVLGSPNMVSTDSERREVWVYDKMSSTSISSSSSGGLFLLIAAKGSETSTKKFSQNTLTVIIKFDSNGLVRDYQYHSSKF